MTDTSAVQTMLLVKLLKNGEIESLLFALQAAIGAIIIGYFFGYWRGQGKED